MWLRIRGESGQSLMAYMRRDIFLWLLLLRPSTGRGRQKLLSITEKAYGYTVQDWVDCLLGVGRRDVRVLNTAPVPLQ